MGEKEKVTVPQSECPANTRASWLRPHIVFIHRLQRFT